MRRSASSERKSAARSCRPSGMMSTGMPSARRNAASTDSGTAGSSSLDASASLDAGRWGDDLAGRLSATARLRGTLSAPRGRIEVAAADLSAGGWRELSLDLASSAEGGSTDLSLRARASGRDILSAQGKIALPPEKLLDRQAALGAPLSLSAEASGVDLSRIPGPWQLAGEVDLRAAASGRAAAPEVELEAAARPAKGALRDAIEALLVQERAQLKAAEGELASAKA